jgi:hypothetical protein
MMAEFEVHGLRKHATQSKVPCWLNISQTSFETRWSARRISTLLSAVDFHCCLLLVVRNSWTFARSQWTQAGRARCQAQRAGCLRQHRH